MTRIPSRRSTAAVLAALLVAGLTVSAAAAVRSATAGGGGRSPSGANASRFLALTGGASAPAQEAGSKPGGRPSGSGRHSGPSARPAERCGAAATTPAGWCIRPAGDQYQVFRFPIGLALASDGKVVVTSDTGGMQGLSVIDPAVPPGQAVTTTPAANLFLGVAVAGDGKVYASGGNADRVFRFRLAGPGALSQDATEAAPFPSHNATNGMQVRFGQQPQALPAGDGIMVGGYPGALALDGSHHLLFVAGSLSEPSGAGTEACPSAQPACARVTVVDTGNDSVVGRFAVGLDAYGLALDGDTLYVSNWGDQAGRGAGVGTVSVVPLDPTTHVPTGESRFVAVGHHPSALEVDPASKKLFVADTNDDQVSVVDTSTSAVTHVPVGVSGAPIGTHPDAFALSPDGSMLFVALAGLNAVQVLDATTGMPLGSTTPSGSPTYIPTGWYPAALRAVPGPGGRTRLWVANAKGEGPGPGINGSVFADGNQSGGTISRVDVDPSRFRAWTQQVIDNDGLDPALDACSVALGPSPAVCPAGSSAIKHVVYIVAENKTFDQYFGDLAGSMPNAGYNADPSYLLYGQPVTPNQHKMLADGVAGLGDNFFSDAEVSVTGHSYTSGAIATDHNEKTWPADYDNGVRGTHGGGDPLRPSAGSKPEPAIQHAEDVLNDPQGGYLFESFVRAGAVPPDKAGPGKLSMGIYGEHTLTVPYNGIDMAPYKAKWTRPDGTTVDWKAGDLQYFDTCRAGQFVSGKTTGGNSPDTDYSRDCEARQLDPQYVLKHWEDAYNGLVPGTPKGTDVMPSFIYMSLPVNHTLGTNLGSPTPASMVADNDYAIGYIVQELSKSPFWGSTAVIIVQDDTQAAGDHVSALRDPVEVIGPLARAGASHQRGSLPSVLRTIETVFAVSPVSLNDQVAVPLHDAFVSDLSQAHPGAYTAVKPVVPFALNQPDAPGQAASMAMDWSAYDLIDMQTLNAVLWADAHHAPFRSPRAPTGRGPG